MAVPCISLAPCLEAGPRGGEPRDLAGLAAAVRAACEEVGFFVVVDHGVDAALLERQRRECAAFFARPPQSLVLGMVPGGSSRFAWLDYVPDASVESGGGEAAAWSLGPVAGRGSQPWRPDTASLAETWAEYYGAMERLVALLMSLFAVALGLSCEAFDAALEGHRSSMRAILYHEVSAEELEACGGEVVRSPEHTDWGCVTVLLPDGEVGGLEIRGKDGTWLPLQPAPGSLVVNLGDLLPWWTGGRWVATPHRVVARPESRRPRLSVPYFGLVNRSTVLRPLLPGPAAGSAEAPLDADQAITAGEFFDRHEELSERRRARVRP